MEKRWNIDMIDAMTEETAKEMALETHEIKGHTVYLVDLGRGFGYSAVVFKNNHHIHYANDYALHHSKEWTREQLKEWYLETISGKLFTEEEIRGPIEDYDDYRKKRYFLNNYYHMMEDYVSCFQYCANEEEKTRYEESKKGLTFNPYGLCYMSNPDFIRHHGELFSILEKRRDEIKDNFAYWKKAFLYEMTNHEYTISWDPDYETLMAFGNISARRDNDLNAWFDELKFTEAQRKAYMAARKIMLRRAG